MKTIQVTDEMFDKLQELAKEYVGQNTRHQAFPHYFTIQSKVEVPAYDGCGEGINYVLDGELFASSVKNLFENAVDYWGDELPHDWNELEEDEKLDWLKDNGVQEYEFNYEFKEQNCFFTSKACDEHIAKNHYHYKEPCSYGNTFWRNPEMQLIANFLVELAKKEIK